MKESLNQYISDKKQALINFFEISKDTLTDFNEKIRNYNNHHDKISQPYKSKIEKMKQGFDYTNNFSQSIFVYSYSLLFIFSPFSQAGLFQSLQSLELTNQI
jgi:hypothetical protein